jgi:SSS family solute:Na+ symporter
MTSLLRISSAWAGVLAASGAAWAAETRALRWEKLPPLPASVGQTVQPGMAGPFAGAHGGVLLVGGGANFPEKMPWDGGAKIWWDDLWVAERTADGAVRWVTEKTFSLPRKLGYGVSIDTPEGVVCIGGHDAERAFADVFRLEWDAAARAVRTTAMPALPAPLTFMAGAQVGSVIYVAGGQHAMKGAEPTTTFWALDLAQRGRGAAWGWERLPAWPGPARVLPVAGAARGARGAAFYLFGGRRPRAGAATEMLTDAYEFVPATRTWRALGPVGGGQGAGVMGATAVTAGESEIVIFGGDGGELFLRLERHDLAIEAMRKRLGALSASAPAEERAGLEAAIAAELAEKRKIYAAHPGFARAVRIFDARTEGWRVAGEMPPMPAVTTTAVRWGEDVVVPTGEIKPGVRTDAVWRGKISDK